MRKRTDKGRRSYRGDLVGQGFSDSENKKTPPKTDRDATENTLTSDTVLEQISGDPYLADLIRKQRRE